MKKIWFLLFFFALLARIIPAIKTPLIGDLPNYLWVGQAVLTGTNPYELNGVYPYPPVWMWWEAAAVLLSGALNIPFQLIVKLPLILADLLIGILIIKMSGQKKEKLKILLFSLYVFNPVSILITAFHGQFDQLVILMILLAIYFLNSRKIWKSSFFLGFSIALKIFPILLLPFFLKHLKINNKKKIKFFLLALLPTGLIFLPFVFVNLKALIKEVFSYSGVTDYGFIAILRAFYSSINGSFTPAPYSYYLLKLSKFIFLGLYSFLTVKMWFIKRKILLLDSIMIVFCLFYFFYGGISSQYLVWLLPFLILQNQKMAIAYSFFATAALLGFYSYFFPEMIFWMFPSLIPNFKIAITIHFLTVTGFWLFLGFLLFSLIKKSRLL